MQYRTYARVMTWHGSYTITIPKDIAEAADLEKGDRLEVLIRKLPEGRTSA